MHDEYLNCQVNQFNMDPRKNKKKANDADGNLPSNSYGFAGISDKQSRNLVSQ